MFSLLPIVIVCIAAYVVTRRHFGGQHSALVTEVFVAFTLSIVLAKITTMESIGGPLFLSKLIPLATFLALMDGCVAGMRLVAALKPDDRISAD